MSIAQAGLIAVLFSVGTFLVLHRSLTRIILGIGLLGNAVNLLILTSGSVPDGVPILGTGSDPADFTDPVPQALVLTAIVIGLAIVAFLLSMAYRSWTIDGNDVVEDDLSDRRIAAEPDVDEDFGEET
ncbi:MAG: sodium:proton antiporter [Actinomycetota bacterium]|nr:sodium:proton antiporter [Actinomycetota bacterium]